MVYQSSRYGKTTFKKEGTGVRSSSGAFYGEGVTKVTTRAAGSKYTKVVYDKSSSIVKKPDYSQEQTATSGFITPVNISTGVKLKLEGADVSKTSYDRPVWNYPSVAGRPTASFSGRYYTIEGEGYNYARKAQTEYKPTSVDYQLKETYNKPKTFLDTRGVIAGTQQPDKQQSVYYPSINTYTPPIKYFGASRLMQPFAPINKFAGKLYQQELINIQEAKSDTRPFYQKAASGIGEKVYDLGATFLSIGKGYIKVAGTTAISTFNAIPRPYDYGDKFKFWDDAPTREVFPTYNKFFPTQAVRSGQSARLWSKLKGDKDVGTATIATGIGALALTNPQAAFQVVRAVYVGQYAIGGYQIATGQTKKGFGSITEATLYRGVLKTGDDISKGVKLGGEFLNLKNLGKSSRGFLSFQNRPESAITRSKNYLQEADIVEAAVMNFKQRFPYKKGGDVESLKLEFLRSEKQTPIKIRYTGIAGFKFGKVSSYIRSNYQPTFTWTTEASYVKPRRFDFNIIETSKPVKVAGYSRRIATTTDFVGGWSASPQPINVNYGVLAGSSATKGLYIAPSLSKYFLKISGETKYTIGLFSREPRPTAQYVITQGYKEIPQSVYRALSKAEPDLRIDYASGLVYPKNKAQKMRVVDFFNKNFFENPELFKGSGKMSISAEYRRGKREDEAIVAVDSALKRRYDKYKFFDYLGGFKEFTYIKTKEGKFKLVPIRVIEASPVVKSKGIGGNIKNILGKIRTKIIKSSFKYEDYNNIRKVGLIDTSVAGYSRISKINKSFKLPYLSYKGREKYKDFYYNIPDLSSSRSSGGQSRVGIYGGSSYYTPPTKPSRKGYFGGGSSYGYSYKGTPKFIETPFIPPTTERYKGKDKSFRIPIIKFDAKRKDKSKNDFKSFFVAFKPRYLASVEATAFNIRGGVSESAVKTGLDIRKIGA